VHQCIPTLGGSDKFSRFKVKATFLYIFLPAGHIERRFINVPFGASWAEVTMRTSAFDTPRRFFLDTVQVYYIGFYRNSYF
jgi:hypothetical protein